MQEEPAVSTFGEAIPAGGFSGNSVWSTTVYLSRHGRTALNAAGALRGQIDVELDQVGQKEAALLGVALAQSAPQAVFSSPLLRAVQTAKAIAQRCGATLIIEERLTDRHYGGWAGVRVDDVVAAWGSVDGAPGVEPGAEVTERALEALRDIVSGAINRTVAIVAHDAVNRYVLAALDPGLGHPEEIAQHTGCFNTIEFHKDGTLPLRWDVLAVDQVPTGDADSEATPTEDIFTRTPRGDL
jgi:broad specificity phosphatase PhoE